MCVHDRATRCSTRATTGIVVVLEVEVPAEHADAAARAVASCPSGALRRVDD